MKNLQKTTYAELICKGWKIFWAPDRKRAGIDFESKTVAFAPGDSPRVRAERLMQLGMVKYRAPETVMQEAADKFYIPRYVLDAVEDLRVHTLVARQARATHTYAPPGEEETFRMYTKYVELPAPAKLLTLLSALDTMSEDFLMSMTPGTVRDLTKQVQAELWKRSEGGLIPFKVTVELAILVTRLLEDMPDDAEDDPLAMEVLLQRLVLCLQQSPAGHGHASGGDSEDAPEENRDPVGTVPLKGRLAVEASPEILYNRGELKPKLVSPKWMSHFYTMRGVSGGPGSRRGSACISSGAEWNKRWAPLKIYQLPLPLDSQFHMNKKAKQPQRTATAMGAVPRNMHRYCVDMSIFTRKANKPSGVSILIDTSGSMAWSENHTRLVLEKAPASIMAMSASTEEEQYLAIIAAKGKRARVQDIRFGGGGNDGDLNALRWLALQPEPRYWVSDGGITPNVSLKSEFAMCAQEVLSFCVEHDITQVYHAGSLIEVLNGRESPPPFRIDGYELEE